MDTHGHSVVNSAMWNQSEAPQVNELLSSWLVRSALGFGMDPLSLTGCIWPDWRVWIHDVDRYLGLDAARRLSSVSGVSSDRIHSMTFTGACPNIFPPGSMMSATVPWLLSKSQRNRASLSGGLFCPSCLSEDKKPYFRWQWRMAFSTGCLRHKCRLISRCPHCHHCVQYILLTASDGTLNRCSHCGNMLSDGRFSPCDQTALAFQSAAERTLNEGMGWYGRYELSASEWFRVIRYLVSVVRASGRRGRNSLMQMVSSISGYTDSEIFAGSCLPLEIQTLEDRAKILSIAWVLFQLDPKTLANEALQNGVTRGLLIGKDLNMPPVLTPFFVNMNECPHSYPSGRRSVSNTPSSPIAVSRKWERIKHLLGYQ